MNKDIIKKLEAFYSSEVIKIRNHIHSDPELSFREFKTSDYICNFLLKNNIPFRKNIAGTGILAEINGKNPGITIALRTELDALPVVEENTCKYHSKNKGVMHACGHDVHMASLMGAALILNKVKDEINGKALLIFQPAEEKLPGGAKQMLDENVFAGLKPHAIIAQHVNPSLKAGMVSYKEGLYMASTDEIYLTVKGKGGHAAMPYQINDTVLASSHIIIALQQIVSRMNNPATPSVLSFGKFIANGATNVIPGEVNIEGTFRTFDEKWRKKALKLIAQMATSVANSMGVQCAVNIINGYPSLYNNEKLTARLIKYSGEYLGKKNVIESGIRMTAEDFAYFAQKYPSVLFRLGTAGDSSETQFPLHSSRFDIDRLVLDFSHGHLAWLAIRLLEEQKL